MEKNVFPGWAYDTEFFEKNALQNVFQRPSCVMTMLSTYFLQI